MAGDRETGGTRRESGGAEEGTGRRHRHRDLEGVPGTERLLTLTDGVVAIALTLLVLQLDVPTLKPGADAHNPGALWDAFTASSFGSQLVAYVISFYVIAQFWLAHHRVFRGVRGHSEALAWWNFLFLFTITLFPFSSALLGRYGDNSLAVIEFAVNLLLASLATTLTLVLARQQGLLDPEVHVHLTRGVGARGAMGAAVIVASIVVALVSPALAKYVWILLALTPWLAAWASRRAEARGAVGSSSG